MILALKVNIVLDIIKQLENIFSIVHQDIIALRVLLHQSLVQQELLTLKETCIPLNNA